MTLQSRVRALESQLSSTKQEKSQLLAALELERAKLQTLEESQHRQAKLTKFSYELVLFTVIFLMIESLQRQKHFEHRISNPWMS
jgi:hypothetical protein